MNKLKQYFLWICMIVVLAFSGCTSGVEESIQEVQSAPILKDDSCMEVHFLDVGQADCTLIKNGNSTMLIDGGNNEDEELILNYLTAQGVKTLDYVIGTHPHEDHIGSLDGIIRHFKVKEVILPEKYHTTRTFEELLTAIDEKNLSITTAKPGESYVFGDGSFTIFAPQEDYGENLNNCSVGIRLVYGEDSFLFSGDAEKKAEEDILKSGATLSSTVFKVSHHGSDTSNLPKYLDAIHPDYAVISCGSNNSYGHPNQSVMEELKSRNIEIFRTDTQGTIVAKSSGSGVTWDCNASTETELEEKNNNQIVSITKTGGKYHRSDCSYLKSSKEEIPLSQVKELGLEPCSRCNPPE